MNSTITKWSHDDQPRNKLINKGVDALSTAELLAILIGNGTKETNAVELARNILIKHPIEAIGRVSLNDLLKFDGIGSAKAVTLLAAIELGRRKQGVSIVQSTQISSSQDAHSLSPSMTDLMIEEFRIILLNRSNRVIKIETISKGGVHATVVDSKVLFKKALDHLACSIILAHNHPSGNLKPSKQDLKLTTKLVEAGKSLDIQILDHLIISKMGYYSFMDEGKI